MHLLTKNMPEPEPLKNCPFCGGKPKPDKELITGRKDGDIDAWAYYVRCISCACQGPWFKTEGNAIRFWNMRTPEET